MKMMKTQLLLTSLLALSAGCSLIVDGSVYGGDGGVSDTGAVDTGTVDTGVPPATCTDDGDCAADLATPRCGAGGVCVQCLGDLDCPGGLCDGTTHSCNCPDGPFDPNAHACPVSDCAVTGCPPDSVCSPTTRACEVPTSCPGRAPSPAAPSDPSRCLPDCTDCPDGLCVQGACIAPASCADDPLIFECEDPGQEVPVPEGVDGGLVPAMRIAVFGRGTELLDPQILPSPFDVNAWRVLYLMDGGLWSSEVWTHAGECLDSSLAGLPVTDCATSAEIRANQLDAAPLGPPLAQDLYGVTDFGAKGQGWKFSATDPFDYVCGDPTFDGDIVEPPFALGFVGMPPDSPAVFGFQGAMPAMKPAALPPVVGPPLPTPLLGTRPTATGPLMAYIVLTDAGSTNVAVWNPMPRATTPVTTLNENWKGAQSIDSDHDTGGTVLAAFADTGDGPALVAGVCSGLPPTCQSARMRLGPLAPLAEVAVAAVGDEIFTVDEELAGPPPSTERALVFRRFDPVTPDPGAMTVVLDAAATGGVIREIDRVDLRRIESETSTDLAWAAVAQVERGGLMRPELWVGAIRMCR